MRKKSLLMVLSVSRLQKNNIKYIKESWIMSRTPSIHSHRDNRSKNKHTVTFYLFCDRRVISLMLNDHFIFTIFYLFSRDKNNISICSM